MIDFLFDYFKLENYLFSLASVKDICSFDGSKVVSPSGSSFGLGLSTISGQGPY